MMQNQTEHYFRTLFEGFDSGVIAICEIPKAGGAPRPIFCEVSMIEMAARKAAKIENHSYVTMGVLRETPRAGSRGKAEDVIGVSCFWHDLDHSSGVHNEKRLPTREQALEFIGSLPLKPSVIIDSGGGYYPQWFFNRPWIFENDGDRKKAADLLKRWQEYINSMAREKGWKLDSTHDLARLLRTPGSLNVKFDEPVPCEIVHMNGVRYSPEDFERVLPKELIKMKVNPKAENWSSYNDWEGSINRLPIKPETRDLIRYGAEKGQRSEAIMTVLNALIFANLSDQKIIEVFEQYPIGEKYMEKGSRREQWLQPQIEKARVYVTSRAENIESSRTRSPEKKVNSDEKIDKWNFATELFPKKPFFWGILPSELSESLKQLARSCATSPVSLPGAAFTIFASTLGRTIAVCPKASWREPLIFWIMDIRKSGEGKSPPARMLSRKLVEKQEEAERDYQRRLEKWKDQKPKDREPEPQRARGFLITQLTLEGARADMEINPNGGVVCLMSELSSFISGQNQYKKRGDDREAWLCLHDGSPARVVRASKSIFIRGARVNVCGGIQPAVWRSAFTSENGIFLQDGTLFRFLPTFEKSRYFELTNETWSVENREVWENLLDNALMWSDEKTSSEGWTPHEIIFDADGQKRFFDWRNDLERKKHDLPESVAGFLPKIVGYAARFAGLLHCLHAFFNNETPLSVLNEIEVERGISAATFYMGHIVDAMQKLGSDDLDAGVEIDDRTARLARTLDGLRREIDGGKLAVGYIAEKYNFDLDKKFKESPKAIGGLIRDCGLTIPTKKQDANGKRSVSCLLWDKKTDCFIKQCLQSLLSLQNAANTTDSRSNIGKPKSAMPGAEADGDEDLQTLQILKKQRLGDESRHYRDYAGFANITDIVSEKNNFADRVKI